MTATFDFILARPEEEYAALLAAVEDFAMERGLTDAVRYRLGLVIDEMVANCIEHGACVENQGIRVSITDLEQDIEIEIIDAGPAFDPTAHAAATCRNGNGNVKVGGVGLCLICNLSTKITYARRGEENHTRITIDKRTQEQPCNSTK